MLKFTVPDLPVVSVAALVVLQLVAPLVVIAAALEVVLEVAPVAQPVVALVAVSVAGQVMGACLELAWWLSLCWSQSTVSVGAGLAATV